MRKLFAAAALVSAVSLTSLAIAQTKPLNPNGQYDSTISAQLPPTANVLPVTPTPDARQLASDEEIGEARRTYRAACEQYESPGFCDCVTAGVAQALMPAEVRIAARTIGTRINAQGDAAIAGASESETDNAYGAESSAVRIEQAEGHYADACRQFRR